MGVSPLIFNGATIVRPGYYTKRNIQEYNHVLKEIGGNV